MRNVLTHAGPEYRPSFWEIFWPRQDLVIDPAGLRVCLEYHYRRERSKMEDIESVAGKAVRCKFVTDRPGRYVSTGNKILRVR